MTINTNFVSRWTLFKLKNKRKHKYNNNNNNNRYSIHISLQVTGKTAGDNNSDPSRIFFKNIIFSSFFVITAFKRAARLN